MTPTSRAEQREEFTAFLAQNLSKDLLRFTTAGSVDDGKSTLIGRLLHDSKTVYEDQLASVKKSRINRSTGPIDFSLLTDGLRAEREQGITIDVGYRYFSTARRKFIIADTPGHEQYTRNMATGASTADLAVILIDGTRGLLPQTTRHTYIASLLGISSVVAAINKMDLMEYEERRFLNLQEEFLSLAGRLGIADVKCIPISALAGDNVVEHGESMSWYSGPTLLEYLETVHIAKRAIPQDFRFPVQYVVRPDANFRGFAGQIAGGSIRQGGVVIALPSGQQSRVESIVTFDGPLAEAFAPMSIILKLRDEIDLSRGDMLVSPGSPPYVSRRFAAMIVWMHAEPLETTRTYLIKHCARQVRGRVTKIRHRVNIDTLEPDAAERLLVNDIASVEMETSSPLFFDSYQQGKLTGAFIVIDALTNATLGAGMIEQNLVEEKEIPTNRKTRGPGVLVAPLERHQRHRHYPAIILIKGHEQLGSKVERALFDAGFEVMLVREENASFTFARSARASLYAAGFIVVYQTSSIGAEETRELKAIAGDWFFDLAGADLPLTDFETVEQILAFAETLRISNVNENPWEAV